MSEQVKSREPRSPIMIRSATPRDAEAIEQILYEATRAAYPQFVPGLTDEKVDAMYRGSGMVQAGTQSRYRREIQSAPQTQHFLVAGYSGSARGYAWVDEDFGDTGERYVRALYAAPGSQNKGVGTRLLYEGLTLLRADENDVRLQVVEGNPAIEFYEKAGFRVERSIPPDEVSSKHHVYDMIEMVRESAPLGVSS